MHGNLMYVKLALCNVRRTAKDYLIYGITLILSIGMFYGFYSLGSPYYSAALPVRMHLSILRQVMRIAVPLVGLLSVFLISYVNAYMFRQKQKEFAVESILGMEQGTVAVLFFLEMLSMGAAAVILSILLGVLLSQGISILVVQSFGEIYRLHFTVFPDTLLGTILFFGLLFLMMGLRNVWLIRRRKVVEMLQDSQSGTDVLPLPKQFGRWAAAGTAVSAPGLFDGCLFREPDLVSVKGDPETVPGILSKSVSGGTDQEPHGEQIQNNGNDHLRAYRLFDPVRLAARAGSAD